MMKKGLLILLCLPMIGFGQQTYVPDNNFEAYLEANGMGNGVPNDDYVTTANIDAITDLSILSGLISDLSGIEDFIQLETLSVDYVTDIPGSLNIPSSLNIPQLPSLRTLNGGDFITSIDMSLFPNLHIFRCSKCIIGDIDFSQNIYLKRIYVGDAWDGSGDIYDTDSLILTNNVDLEVLSINSSSISYIDISNSQKLSNIDYQGPIKDIQIASDTFYWFFLDRTEIICLDLSMIQDMGNFSLEDNLLLKQINLKNGNPAGFTAANSWVLYNNNFINCIQVDNVQYAQSNWGGGFNYQTNCDTSDCSQPLSIEEHTTNKELLKVTDLLGRETKGTKNEILFYIYDDETVEKRIVIK